MRDGRGTIDVFLYADSTWQGPYSIRKTDNSQYVITAPPYDYDAAVPVYNALPILYDEKHIPQQILSSFPR